MLLGIMLGYAILNGLGSLFWKIGLNKFKSEELNFLKIQIRNFSDFFKLVKTPIWTLGWILIISDFFVYQLALSKYEVSVVKPLVNLNLIFVIVFGVVIMKENIILREWISIFCIILGSILITINAKESSTEVNIVSLVIFTSVIGIILVISVIALLKSPKSNYEFFVSIFCGALYGLGSLFNKSAYSVGIGTISFFFFMLFWEISYLLAFLYGQMAYLKGRMSMVSPIVNIVSILVPFFGGVLVLGESFYTPDSSNSIISFAKLSGLMIIIVGIMLSYKKTTEN